MWRQCMFLTKKVYSRRTHGFSAQTGMLFNWMPTFPNIHLNRNVLKHYLGRVPSFGIVHKFRQFHRNQISAYSVAYKRKSVWPTRPPSFFCDQSIYHGITYMTPVSNCDLLLCAINSIKMVARTSTYELMACSEANGHPCAECCRTIWMRD